MKRFFLTLCASLSAIFLCSCENFSEKPKRVESFFCKAFQLGTFKFDAKKCNGTFILLGTSYCPYCKPEGEALALEYTERKKDGFCALYVSEDSSEYAMEEFAKKVRYPFPVLYWNYNMMNALGNPRFVPARILLDNAGNVLEYSMGGIGKDSLRVLMAKHFGNIKN